MDRVTESQELDGRLPHAAAHLFQAIHALISPALAILIKASFPAASSSAAVTRRWKELSHQIQASIDRASAKVPINQTSSDLAPVLAARRIEDRDASWELDRTCRVALFTASSFLELEAQDLEEALAASKDAASVDIDGTGRRGGPRADADLSAVYRASDELLRHAGDESWVLLVEGLMANGSIRSDRVRYLSDARTPVDRLDGLADPPPSPRLAEAARQQLPLEVPPTSPADQADPADAGSEDTRESDTDDWALVRATQGGDIEAFGTLFDRYHDVVHHFAFYRLGDRGVAEDLTQDTFVQAFRRVSSMSYQGDDLGVWLVAIAKTLVTDYVERQHRLWQAKRGTVDVAHAQDRPVAGSAAINGRAPESEVIRGATHEELLRCVNKLEGDQKECISLRFLQGLSVSETARSMGRNEDTVKNLQLLGARRLLQLMPSRSDDEASSDRVATSYEEEEPHEGFNDVLERYRARY